MLRTVKPLRRLALAAGLALAGILVAPVAAAADESDPTDVRWSVTPADESGLDDRLSIQHALEAGESATDHIAVRNLGDEEATFRLSAADGFTTRSGRFDMVASDKESVDAGTWIDIADDVTVGAGESAIVPFTITVPDGAEPGDHPAGVAASVITSQASGDGTSLGVESRVGVKVITRVKGDLAPQIEIENVSAEYNGTWNPLRPGTVTATFDLTNAGNTRLIVDGLATAGTGEAAFPADGEPIGDLLPGDTREVSITIDGTWPTFYAPGDLVVTPTAAALDGAAPDVDEASASLGVWAVPWPQLVVLLALALIIIAATWNRRRGKRRLDAMLQQAREEGKRQASTGRGTASRVSIARALPAVAFTLLVAAASVTLAPDIAMAASDSGSDGVGVHVDIVERDDAGADADADGSDASGDADADGSDASGDADAHGADASGDADATGAAANDDADSDGSGSELPATGTDPSLMIALGAAGAVACGTVRVLARRRFARGQTEAQP
ncbi:MAG: WxL protein peptidoglycan domain-containing protein [Candidatus Microbacterium stercoravium]